LFINVPYKKLPNLVNDTISSDEFAGVGTYEYPCPNLKSDENDIEPVLPLVGCFTNTLIDCPSSPNVDTSKWVSADDTRVNSYVFDVVKSIDAVLVVIVSVSFPPPIAPCTPNEPVTCKSFVVA